MERKQRVLEAQQQPQEQTDAPEEVEVGSAVEMEGGGNPCGVGGLNIGLQRPTKKDETAAGLSEDALPPYSSVDFGIGS